MEQLLFNVAEASKVLGIARSKLYMLIKDGEIETVKLGDRRLVPEEALRNFVRKLRSRNS